VIIAPSILEARAQIADWRRQGASIALVPTMGFFHAGHQALMKKAAEKADKVIVSLFVNPTQFGPNEDLASYPRDPEGDRKKARESGVALLFCPSAETMYAADRQTTVDVSELSKGLCGAARPGHFRGVCTVVSKLLNIIQPDYAIFGEKDFQQLAIVKKLVDDLNFPTQIIGHPIVREPDGLAMSSRNAYLKDDERKVAVVLYRALCEVRKALEKGIRETSALKEMATGIIAEQPICSMDYFTIINEQDLAEVEKVDSRCRAIGAIYINNKVRLIDNTPLYG